MQLSSVGVEIDSRSANSEVVVYAWFQYLLCYQLSNAMPLTKKVKGTAGDGTPSLRKVHGYHGGSLLLSAITD